MWRVCLFISEHAYLVKPASGLHGVLCAHKLSADVSRIRSSSARSTLAIRVDADAMQKHETGRVAGGMAMGGMLRAHRADIVRERERRVTCKFSRVTPRSAKQARRASAEVSNLR